jgi:hypothetical protein
MKINRIHALVWGNATRFDIGKALVRAQLVRMSVLPHIGKHFGTNFEISMQSIATRRLVVGRPAVRVATDFNVSGVRFSNGNSLR